MPSSLTSNSAASAPILEVRDLSLTFKANVHRHWTWRDWFVGMTGKRSLTSLQAGDPLKVLKSVSFSVNPGERVGILGVNGTGKTSLCRCIAGVYRPSSGQIRLQGQVRAIFDTSIGIYPELTGRENARLLAKFMYPGMNKEHEEMVREALEFSGLGEFIDVPYRLYSNGMQARLCLSMISCRPGNLLILDEVFDGADLFFREKISGRIHSLIEKSTAALFVSHSPDQIKRVCSRVLILHQGRVAHDGDVADGLTTYRELNRHKP